MNRKHERGAAIVLIVAGLAALVGMAGLALDVGHLGLNKARLQATVDAAALTAAKVLSGGQSLDDATAAAKQVFAYDATKFPELSRVLTDKTLTLDVQYSEKLDPFVSGATTTAKYVRVVATNFNMWHSLSRAIGVTSMSTAASAVSGPLPLGNGNGAQICNVFPVLLCSDPAGSATNNWGFTPGKVIAAKMGSGTNSPENELGPGNYHLLRSPPFPPGEVRDPLAGANENCITIGGNPEIEDATTNPGVKAGPTWQGVNTRFGDYQGANLSDAEFPPDVVIDEVSPSLACPMLAQGGGIDCANPTYKDLPITNSSSLEFNYSRYRTMVQARDYDYAPIADGGKGVAGRRNVALPVAKCEPDTGGGPATFTVQGYACMFLLQKVPMGGNDNIIFGEVTSACNAGGTPGPGPVAGPGSGQKIVLFNDVGSADS